MITIKSPQLKTAEVPEVKKPWEFDAEDLEDLEELTPAEEEPFRPVRDDDFKPVAPPKPPPRPWEFDMDEAADLVPLKPDTEGKPYIGYTFLPMAPMPAESKVPVNPSELLGDEVVMPTTPIEDANDELNVPQKIYYSLYNSVPLRITYTTLDGGSMSERTIHPDHVYWAGTNRHILVAWDELRGDWRAFAVNNIDPEKTKLMEVGT